MRHRLLTLTLSLATFAVGLPTADAVETEHTAPVVAETQTTSGPTARKAGGWQLIFRDDFDGPALDTDKWSVWTGGQRRASNVIVSDGTLKLRTTREPDGSWTYSGIGSPSSLKRTYGRYTIRARLEAAQGTRAVGLLWPTGGVWPPEINFFEVSGDDPQRRRNLTANHYVDNGVHRIQHALVEADYTQWHRVGVVWKPRSLRFMLDGEVVAVQRGQVPHREMWVGLQTAIGTGDGAPNASTPDRVDFEVDWVKVKVRGPAA